MKRKKLMVAEKHEVAIMPGARIVSPIVSKSKNIQATHVRRYDTHRTWINPERTAHILPPVTEPIRLPGPTVKLPPIIQKTTINKLEEAYMSDLKDVIEDVLKRPWFYLVKPSHNLKDWNELVMADVLPKIGNLKVSWDKTSKNDDAILQVSRFLDNIMNEANNMAKVLDKRRISFAKQKLLENKIVELYTNEWMANSETVIPLDIADYFLKLFRAYWDGDINRDELNVHLGGDLWDIEAKIGEEL